ncbi:4-alpha-glucanotransferase [Endozoicomonas sp. OPT23]|uniref:4-alpha-glucanotransferase n=1 Tax=Endozoicomonas sp. OPT23 TaxID=2072845 RepID=UPI00129AD3E0|nr:4-alpha-glucanotransferase [Endozoicomonas sp. OPT23]MRI31889.1 4-alpha-glucanotransferase [Endozoicomonas sp. OPT23]
MSDLARIETLAAFYGVSGEYSDWAGNPVTVPTEYKIPILEAMGVDVSSDENITRSFQDRLLYDWNQLIPPVVVMTQGHSSPVPVNLPADKLNVQLKGALELENGETLPLTVDTAKLETESVQTVEGTEYHRLTWHLPDNLSLGYHQLSLKERTLSADTLVIVTPETCYEPGELTQGTKIWGSSVQLYTIRTEHDWGMGDFSSLKYLATELAAQGAHIVGLNPIHSLYPANPHHCSPYSPSSRNFINPLYLDVTAIADFQECEAAQKKFKDKGFQELLSQARAEEFVDYGLVAHLKYQLLEVLFEHFTTHHLEPESARAKEFKKYCASRGDSLKRHALYEAIYAHYKAIDFNNWGWPCWEELFQQHDSNAVNEFASQNQHQITYYMYLQWLSELQLAEAQQAALEAGMLVGIYRDLAVGVDSGGSDVWSNPDVYCLNAGAGAPPDAVAPQGQNWGLPPFNPATLKQQKYAPFIEMVRANMSHCGALRIDHVMGLLRLWWCPQGKTADFGAYVYYPLDDLLGIIKLESLRHKCLVFGEDLGTVPPEIKKALPPARFYSNEVVLFECLGDYFTRPESFKSVALTCVSNHDIPTFKAWWECLDLNLRHQLDIYDSNKTESEKVNRHKEKTALLRTMIEAGEAPWGMNPNDIHTMTFSRDLFEKLHYFLARTSSRIISIQLEDILEVETPVNIPGTSDEYPNWRRKLTSNLEYIFRDSENQMFFQNISIIRKD